MIRYYNDLILLLFKKFFLP